MKVTKIRLDSKLVCDRFFPKGTDLSWVYTDPISKEVIFVIKHESLDDIDNENLIVPEMTLQDFIKKVWEPKGAEQLAPRGLLSSKRRKRRIRNQANRIADRRRNPPS